METDRKRHATERLEMLVLSAALSKIYAQDESETANVTAIEAIKRSFHASAAALFYVNGKREFRVCLAGTHFPIALPEERWKSCAEGHVGEALVVRFGSWSMPGIEISLPAWISTRLYVSGDEGGYVFLGKEREAWDEAEMSALASIRETIAPIIEIRHERDVEEQKRRVAEALLVKNESRLRDLFEGSRDMIYTANADDIITSANAATLTFLGYPSKSDILGKSFSSFVLNPSDRASFLAKLSEHGYVDDYELVLSKNDGTATFCVETAHILKDKSGKTIEMQGIVKDITERIMNERDLWKMNMDLTETNIKLKKTQVLMVQNEKLAAIGQLAAGVAHEINNPLGFLISNHSILEKYYKRILAAWQGMSVVMGPAMPDFEKKWKLSNMLEDLEQIFAESRDGLDRVAKIVGNLKAFSRVDRGSDFDTYDVNAGIESTLTVAWNEIKYVAELRKHLGDIPLIRAKGGEINQIILNMVINAVQAIESHQTGEKGILEITTRTEGESVVIMIRDNGPGIPKEIQNRIFEPFFTTKEPGKGTGLGLSVSYDIVSRHDGSFRVESEPGKGTAFFVILPVAGPLDSQKTE